MVDSVGISGPILIGKYLKYLNNKDSVANYAHLGMGGTQVNLIALELLERGYRVFLYTLDPRIKKGEELTLLGNNLLIHVGSFPSGRSDRYVNFKRDAVSFLCEQMKKDQPSVIHAHWTGEYARAAINSGLPYLVSVRDWKPAIWRCDPFSSLLGQLTAMLEQMYVLRKSKYTSPNSEYIRNKISKLCPGRMVETIPNFIDDNSFRPISGDIHFFRDFSIVSINNGFGKHKNIKTLLRAFKLVKSKCSFCQLHLAGSAHELNGVVHKWAKKCNLDAGVFFLGELNSSEIANLIHRCHLLVHPSLEESFGNTLIEAMVRGLIVIGGRDSGAVPWVLNYGDAGILVNVRSAKSIADACMDLIENRDKREIFAKKGFSWAQDNFSSTAVLPKLLKLYSDIQSKEMIKQGKTGVEPD